MNNSFFWVCFSFVIGFLIGAAVWFPLGEADCHEALDEYSEAVEEYGRCVIHDKTGENCDTQAAIADWAGRKSGARP